MRNLLKKLFGLLRNTSKNRKTAYRSYAEYLKHQTEKTLDPQKREKWLGEEWQIKYQAFLDLFNKHSRFVRPGLSAVCLGARTGQEVKALRDLGLEARGFDLVPCEPYVEQGDVHHLALADSSTDFVFSNIFDHCLYPEVFISEIERILKSGGHALLLLQVGKPIRKESYDVTYVGSSADVIRLFSNSHLIIDSQVKDCLGMNWEVAVQKI